MPTTNKSLTTYLPPQSVEWLEKYCLDYKHLQNKEGNPKLGTAIADIIARLSDGELSLPVAIDPQSTLLIQYGTEIGQMRGEIEELKKLISEYGTPNLPDPVLNLEVVKDEIDKGLQPTNTAIIELETYAKSQFDAVREELKKALSVGVASLEKNRAVIETTDSIAKPAHLIDEADPNRKTWRDFFTMVGMTSMTSGEAKKKENIIPRDKQADEGMAIAKEMGLGVWKVTRPGRTFVKVEDKAALINPTN